MYQPCAAALPGKGLPWCGAGVAQSEMPPKKNEDSTWTIGGGGRVVQSCCSDPPGRV